MRIPNAMLAAAALCGTGLLAACGGNSPPATTTTGYITPMPATMPATRPAPLMPATPGTVRAEAAHARPYPNQ